MQPIPALPIEEPRLRQLEASLTFLVVDIIADGSVRLKSGTPSIPKLPAELYPILNQSYLPGLTEAFSKASHEGECDLALSTGRTLLAVYVVIYPSNFPLIGTINCDLCSID